MSEDRLEGTFKKGFGHVQDAVGGLTGDAKTTAQGKLNQAAGSIQDGYGKALGQAQDAASEFKDWTQDLYGQIEDFVEGQPAVALCAAVGVGVLLGMAMRGGRKTVYVRK